MLLHFHEYNKPLTGWPKLNLSWKRKIQGGVDIIRNQATFKMLSFRKY